MKKAVTFVALLVVFTLLFTSCGGAPSASQAPASTPASTAEPADSSADTGSGEVVTLRWLMQGSTPEELAQWQELADYVHEVHPDIKVELSTTDWAGYWTKLPTEIAGGNPPDLMYMQVMRAKTYMEDGFEPLNRYIEADPDVNFDDFATDVVNGLSVDDTVYALPYDVGPFILYYNIDLFESQGVPLPTSDMTFDEFVTLAQSFTGDDTHGYAMGPKIDSIVPFVWSDGGDYFDESGKFVINSPAIVETVQRLADMQKAGGGSAPLTETGNTTWDREQFCSGNVGMYMNGTWMVTNLETNCDFRIGAVVVPAGTVSRNTTIAGSGFAISKDSKHKEEAWRALVTLTSAESQTKLATWGRALPSRDSVREAFYEMHTDIVGLKETVETSSAPPIARAYVTPRDWTEVQATINQNLESVWLGESDAQTALDTAQGVIDGILGQ